MFVAMNRFKIVKGKETVTVPLGLLDESVLKSHPIKHNLPIFTYLAENDV